MVEVFGVNSDVYINAPFDREFIDIKLMSAYFGTSDEKIEVSAGDMNVPITISFTNVGTQDITGIRGQLSTHFDITPAFGNNIVQSDSNTNAKTGDMFYLTFYVDIDPHAKVQYYPASVQLDYSRVRESGVRNESFDFKVLVTGTSIVNVKTSNDILTSLQSNEMTFEIINDGDASISDVKVDIQSVDSDIVISKYNWELGSITSDSSKTITTDVYIPSNIKDETLQIPIIIRYNDVNANQREISRTVDFYVKGLIDLKIFNIDVIELSNNKIIVGEIINEGNQDGLFGFISLESRKDSNLVSQQQFIDEIEIDSPVPFNIPIEFEGEPIYGEHDITLNLRYKDGTRDEMVIKYNDTVMIHDPVVLESSLYNMMTAEDSMNPMIIVIPILIIIGVIVTVFIIKRKRRNIS